MRQLKITKSITNRESASLEKYLQEIGHERMISTDEEVALAQRIKQGDSSALEELTRANLRFVVSVAKQYQNQGLSLPDLINEGNLGLIKAAQLTSTRRGDSSSYPTPSGGYVRASFRPLPSRAVWSGSRSTKWGRLIRSTVLLTSLSRSMSADPVPKSLPVMSIYRRKKSKGR